jgi:hypothetical protein
MRFMIYPPPPQPGPKTCRLNIKTGRPAAGATGNRMEGARKPFISNHHQ